jgi:hypothetical protein
VQEILECDIALEEDISYTCCSVVFGEKRAAMQSTRHNFGI